MSKLSYLKKIVITAVCIAMCLVLPFVFHSVPNGGKIFCPMHIPVLLCGLVCGPVFGALCGAVGTVLSSIMFNMPIFAMVPSMASELAVYGLVSGIMMSLVHTKRSYIDIYISLICAMLAGRLAAGVLSAFIFTPDSFSVSIWATAYFVTSLPGALIQLIILPCIFLMLQKAKLIPKRY